MTYKYKHLSPEILQNSIDNNVTGSKAAISLGITYNTFKRLCVANKIQIIKNQSRKGIKRTKKETESKTIPLYEILDGKHPQYQTYKLKLRLFQEGIKEKVCESCRLTVWLGREISLELHHKDGNSNNHMLSNLKIICPNCHTLTDTFCSKNKYYQNGQVM